MNEELLQKAIDIATAAHSGQLDKAGAPYIDHPLRVMAAGSTTDEKIVGVLHDIIEDSEWTFEALAAEGFPAHIINALRHITHLPDETYEKFIARVKKNPLATAVKLNDLSDNMDIRRLPYLSDKDVKRLKRYLKAYKRYKGRIPQRLQAMGRGRGHRTAQFCCRTALFRRNCRPLPTQARGYNFTHKAFEDRGGRVNSTT